VLLNTRAKVDPPWLAEDSAYPWFVTVMLALAYAVAFIDRQVLNLLVDPIKQSLLLSDVKFSLLQGLAFMLAYMAMGVVFGRLADQKSRRNLLILAVVTWCTFTVACAFTKGFWSFFGARAGIGAAEACLLPAGWSLLADYFSRERLPRAMSIFVLGPFVGAGLALIFGGLVLQHLAGSGGIGLTGTMESWRIAFILVGAPGLLVAVVLLAVREPPRRTRLSSVEDPHFSLNEVLVFIWREKRFYGGLFGGVALLVVGVYALPAWTPTLLIRAHGGRASLVGIQYGLATLTSGCLGVLLGPFIARQFARRYPHDAAIRATMLAAVGAGVACLALTFAGTYWSAVVASATASGCANIALPIAAASVQIATPNRMRGVITSIYAFVLNGVGLGLGPTLVALVTDHVLHDPAKVAIAMGAVVGVAAVAALPLLSIASSYQQLGKGRLERI
jgi:MFS family permease